MGLTFAPGFVKSKVNEVVWAFAEGTIKLHKPNPGNLFLEAGFLACSFSFVQFIYSC
jgi:hypothetical protein